MGNRIDSIKKDIVTLVTEFYLKSSDFNGIPLQTLLVKVNVDWSLLKPIIEKLILDETIRIKDDTTDINPHIIRLGFEPTTMQLQKLNSYKPGFLYHVCIYPTKEHLKSVVNPNEYAGEPYKLQLALGEPQLAYRSFDLSVLEFYRNDPRYGYDNDDVRGYIYCNTEQMDKKDKILLQTFGFSYDEDYNRAVAVFLRFLCDLTSEHQMIWRAKELHGTYKLHPDYYRNTVIGGWGERVPICSALLKELFIINQMAKAMGRPPLFKEDFGKNGERRPKRFGFLVRPTLEEFNSFIHLLDKMLSENINKDFFREEVPYEKEIKRKDGRIQVQQKGTLQILDEWIRRFFKTQDWQPWNESIATLRKIRKLRQKPAHSIYEDKFDQKYFKEQRKIILDAYNAVRTIRLMLANHPKVKAANIKVPDWLYKGKIWSI